MPGNRIERIRNSIRLGKYDMTSHAAEEMAEDHLDISDVEQAILTGKVIRIEKDDPRGTRYVIVGTGTDDIIPVGVAGRFTETQGLFIL